MGYLFKLVNTINLFYVTSSIAVCDSGQNNNGDFMHKKKLCINQSFEPYIVVPGINIIWNYSLFTEAKYCDVIINVLNVTRKGSAIRNFPQLECPGSCNESRSINISLSDLENISTTHMFLLTCTYSSDMLGEEFFALNRTQKLSQLLEIIYFRRIQECSEKDKWIKSTSVQLKDRRKVEGLHIWIGTIKDRVSISLQASVLPAIPTLAHWLATEDQYPCAVESLPCMGADPRGRHTLFMPGTGYMTKLFGCG